MVRLFTSRDWSTIEKWWGSSEAKPALDLLPDTTFVVEENNVLLASAALFLTNSKYACWIEQVIGNPEISKELRNKAVNELFLHLEAEAKSKGFKAVCIFSYIDKLKNRYESLGFQRTRENITTFSKLI